TSAWTSSRRRCLLQVYRSRGPTQTSPGKNTGCPAAPAPITAPASVGFWASRLETRSPGRSGLHRGSLAFGAAVRLGLLLHTASRRQLWRLPTAVTACSCLQLAVATNSPRKGLSPPIQCPCQAHLLTLLTNINTLTSTVSNLATRVATLETTVFAMQDR